MITQDKIDDFNARLALLNEESKGSKSITAFPEITLTQEQLAIISEPMFGFEKDNLQLYYKGKIQGELLLTSSRFVTSEDQPDFQYLIDLGVKAIAAGMLLKEENGNS